MQESEHEPIIEQESEHETEQDEPEQEINTLLTGVPEQLVSSVLYDKTYPGKPIQILPEFTETGLPELVLVPESLPEQIPHEAYEGKSETDTSNETQDENNESNTSTIRSTLPLQEKFTTSPSPFRLRLSPKHHDSTPYPGLEYDYAPQAPQYVPLVGVENQGYDIPQIPQYIPIVGVENQGYEVPQVQQPYVPTTLIGLENEGYNVPLVPQVSPQPSTLIYPSESNRYPTNFNQFVTYNPYTPSAPKTSINPSTYF